METTEYSTSRFLEVKTKQVSRSGKEADVLLLSVGPVRDVTLLMSKARPWLREFIERVIVKKGTQKVLRAPSELPDTKVISQDLISHADNLIKSLGFTVKISEQQRLDQDLLSAALAGDSDGMLRAIIKGADVNAKTDDRGQSVAHICADNMHARGITLLYPTDADKTGVLEGEDYDIEFLGGREYVEARWNAALEKFDPLAEDSEGVRPSSLYPLPDPSLFKDTEVSADYHLQEMLDIRARIMQAEITTARKRGLDINALFGEGYRYSEMVKRDSGVKEASSFGDSDPEPNL